MPDEPRAPVTPPAAAGAGHALRIERGCSLVAAALSEGRREGARLMSGDAREFGLSPKRSIVHLPYPALGADWTLRTWTCGVALQCAPSKDRLAHYPAMAELSERELRAVAIAEGE